MSNTPSTHDPELARARAAAYGLIAHGFQYPDRAGMATLVDPGRWEVWPSLLEAVDGKTGAALQPLREAVKAAAGCGDAEPRALQERYDALFGHAVRGQCPAYEMEYGRNEIIRQASDLADIAGFYGAFGLEIAEDAHGRPDHITAECDFMSALCLKAAHAQTQGDEENATLCIDAQRTFLRDHLARWLPAFAQHVKTADPSGLYGLLARFADAFVKAECRMFDVHAGPATLELKPPDPVLDRGISCQTAGCAEGQAGEPLVQLESSAEEGRGR